MLHTKTNQAKIRNFPEVELFSKKAGKYKRCFAHYFDEVTAQEGSCISIGGERKLNFCTYSYLGLLDHPEVKKGALRAMLKYGCGTHGVRLLGDNLSLYNELEKRLARFSKRQDAMLFSSGYLANQTVIRALVRPGDVIYCEQRSHASIVDGCQQANAQVIQFRHEQWQQLDRMLSQQPAEQRKIIVADAVFSMDGDILDLPAYLALRDRYPNTFLMIDEAHSIGVLGKRGLGIEEHFAVTPDEGIDIKMGTLSKAIPGNGGFIAADHNLINYLRFHTRGYIFTSTLSPPTAGAAIASLDVLESEGQQRIQKFWSNVKYLRKSLADYKIKITPSLSPITGVLIGNQFKAFEVSKYCFDKGLYILPVAYPAVPRGSERIRLTVNCDHTFDEIDQGVAILAEACVASKHIGQPD